MKKLLLTGSMFVIALSINSNNASAQCTISSGPGSVQCLNYKGDVIPNSFCSNHQEMPARPPTPAAITCPTPCPPSNNDRDRDRSSYIDVDGDGRGDFRTAHEAERAGFSGNNGIRGNYDTVDHYGRSSGVSNVVQNNRDSNSNSDSDSSRVICTYFFLNGEISKDYYYADYEYTLSKIHPNTVKGYHFWAIPYVEKMYNNPEGLLTKLIRPVAIHRAEELAYKMGVRSKPNYLGKFFRLCIEPACFIIGAFVKPKDYKHLYTKEYLEYAANKYRKHRLRKENNEKFLPGFPAADFRI